ncbi:hypothetical protein NEMBOFW57_000739 [Staphylotrichum longicolle]|uniref:HNH nuclease domain-containing protein n=1 Tax=Staphylotrichum longicolle TaxID=669026 RepID=A0AAD4F0C5_9PEZI|nr:hypothetical protein NEMBOFW57_000739 [Staphylotrichum longicolle]
MDPDLSNQILAAVAAEPETVRRLVCDIPPAAEPVADYITDLEERCRLFDQLRQLHQKLNQSPPNAATLGFVMVAPLSEIHDGEPLGMGGWNKRGGDTGNRCLDPAAAHVFPFATSEKKQFGSIAGLLQAFWGADKANAWRRHFEEARIPQSPKNYLSMSHQIHFWFDNARLALKPLRQSPNEIVVQWHWLKKSSFLPRTEISQAQDTFLHHARLNDVTWGSCLAHRRSGVPIQTGQTFVIRAEKPEDLPSFELLEMQWNLLRVAAICGAADVSDASYYNLDDDQVCHLIIPRRDETVTTRQNEAVTEAAEDCELDHTGSPSDQVEQTLPHHYQTHAANAFRNG